MATLSQERKSKAKTLQTLVELVQELPKDFKSTT